MVEDTLKKRYFYKVSTNFINFGLSLVIQGIVPRALGPALYGSYSFLTTFFQQINGFFDLWITPGFYIKLSQRPRESNLVSFALLFFSLSSCIVLITFLFIPSDSGIYRQLWPDQEFQYILLAAIWAALTWLLQLMNYMSDAYGLTVQSEKMRMFQKFFGMGLIILLYILHKLNLQNYFYYNFIIMILLLMSLVIIIKNNGYQIVNLKFPFNELKKYFSEFYIFSSPLFLSGVVALICGVLDRWLLQFFSGSVQQGFYGFSFQIGMVCFIFTSAMTPLIMREFSIAFNQKNINQISNLFRKYIPLLYGIAAYISCFIAFQAAKIIHIMGGEEYKDAALAVAIMSIYPIHQTYGQLSGSVFMATGQTRLYGKIAIIFMVLGLPLTYFLIASKSNMGIDAGATGLAVKMVIIQIVSVNVQLYFNSKYLNLKFWRYFIHQFASLIILLAVSFLSMILIDKIFVINEQIISFLVSGIIYTILVITLVYFKPIIMGLSRVDILYIVDQIKTRIR